MNNNNNMSNGQPVVRNGMNGLSGSAASNNNANNKTSVARPNGLVNGNKFTPDTEFVADFGSAKTDNANADFADFEHNPIFNASGN